MSGCVSARCLIRAWKPSCLDHVCMASWGVSPLDAYDMPQTRSHAVLISA